MTPHDLFTMYSVKAVEYLLAVAFLLFFIPFWRFLNGGRAAEGQAVAEVPGWLGRVADWFLVPDFIYFHPGHAWARVDTGDLVTVGMDDFAQKLIGKPSAIALPEVGSQVSQGERAWRLMLGSQWVDMLSPVDGTVVAVNERVHASPETINLNPYEEAWLIKVRAQRLGANLKQLLSGSLARRWMEEACEQLSAMISPDLGRLYQDGGLPIHGMARRISPTEWDHVVRSFFLT
ncbi:MAG: glycine cleavage system protein H [Deltaproteobacteria bacterium]|nr:glycine cleavage system protein H [Deltaproteobacteria bacterium]